MFLCGSMSTITSFLVVVGPEGERKIGENRIKSGSFLSEYTEGRGSTSQKRLQKF